MLLHHEKHVLKHDKYKIEMEGQVLLENKWVKAKTQIYYLQFSVSGKNWLIILGVKTAWFKTTPLVWVCCNRRLSSLIILKNKFLTILFFTLIVIKRDLVE